MQQIHSARNYGHLYGEAYMLMGYECNCGHKETIWNSRDGITPASTGCAACGGTMKHKNWNADIYAPTHKPAPRDLIWRDGTPDEAAAFMAERLDKCMGTPYEVEREYGALLINRARDGLDDEFKPGWPMLAFAT